MELPHLPSSAPHIPLVGVLSPRDPLGTALLPVGVRYSPSLSFWCCPEPSVLQPNQSTHTPPPSTCWLHQEPPFFLQYAPRVLCFPPSVLQSPLLRSRDCSLSSPGVSTLWSPPVAPPPVPWCSQDLQKNKQATFNPAKKSLVAREATKKGRRIYVFCSCNRLSHASLDYHLHVVIKSLFFI